jgi:hypothetical protein
LVTALPLVAGHAGIDQLVRVMRAVLERGSREIKQIVDDQAKS